MNCDHPQVKSLKRADAFLAHLTDIDVVLPFADPPDLDALRAPVEVAGRPASTSSRRQRKSAAWAVAAPWAPSSFETYSDHAPLSEATASG